MIDLTGRPKPGELAFEWPDGFVPTYVDDALPHQIRLVARVQEGCAHSNSHTCTGSPPKVVMVECSCGDLHSTVPDPDADEALAIWRAHVAVDAL